MNKDTDYLEEHFPKGKTKFRGEAMVLLALSRQVGKEELGRRIWGDLLLLISNLNIATYKTPLSKETLNYVDYMRKEINKLIKKWEVVSDDKGVQSE
jgi:hypothetical protein